MASLVARATLAKSAAMHNWVGRMSRQALLAQSAASPVTVQVATMRATYGEPYPYKNPYPYETKKFRFIDEIIGMFTGEKSLDRMNENSKVLIVDGNIGVGKEAFAARIAHNFDMRLFPMTPDSVCFTKPGSSFDLRSLDPLLPAHCRQYDLNRFLAETNPESGYMSKLQYAWYIEKFFTYMRALAHLMHTGQGVVLVQPVYSDMVFLEAFKRLGWISLPSYRFLMDLRANSLCELMTPHVVLYLDTPLQTVRERIVKNNDPREVNSPVLTDKYLETIDNSYKQVYLPKMRTHSEVVEINWAEIGDDNDMDVICEELQSLHLESENGDDKMFQDWYMLSDDDIGLRRRMYSRPDKMIRHLYMGIPTECSEFHVRNSHDSDIVDSIIGEHPCVKYENGWAPELGNKTLWRL